jgi:hypothetical protein
MISYFVIDNFLEKPNSAREGALKQTFRVSTSYKGFRSDSSRFSEEIDNKLKSIIGSDLEYVGASFMYHYSLAGTPEVYHADPKPPLGDWGGVLYLTPNAPLESGTSLFRHKKTGMNSGDPSRFSTQPQPYCYLDPTEWYETDFVGNIYNRLILFRGDRIHSMRKPFGYSPETARLTQLFFFNEKR